ncbi:glycosyltransferase family 4 protein [Lutibacter aestuarii]|uniref:Glycosyltransferase family 4 protein n=1 Tax=Lutibacter aestuarii TaxID=861111 RepID=A0ABW2Z8T2_9FLAO
MYRIGIQYNYYPEQRNIIDIIKNGKYLKIEKENKLTSKVLRKIKKILRIKKSITVKDIYSLNIGYTNEVDFFHFFNSILYGKNNWGVTFETLVPFHEEDIINDFLRDKQVLFKSKSAVKKLAKPNCKFIIALSECSFKIQSEYLNYFPSLKNDILNKMHVMHPPQELLMYNYKKPNFNEGINFMFVGNEILRKGGIEILRVFNAIKNDYKNFTLTLIGDFEKSKGRYFLVDEELNELQSIINNNEDRIFFLKSLPNDEVLKMMTYETHVGLLPTHADTYGYSVLEFQSAGCPVITTNIRALPEINDEDCGWLIDIPKSDLGEPFSNEIEELIHIQEIIENQLKKIMIEILENPEIIKTKGVNSIKRIKEKHCMHKYSENLANIYNNFI